MKKRKVDLCVIGAGSAGLSVAAGAAQLGIKVALIEHNKMGGDCLNYGCIPSKSLLAAAKRAHLIQSSGAFGIEKIKPKIDFNAVHDHIHDVIKTIAPQDSVERFQGLGVEVIQASASFLSPKVVKAGQWQIESKYFVIATGSSPAIPALEGIQDVPYLTNETLFDLKEKPEHLIVIGGGPIGCEMSQAYALMGVKTSLLETSTLLSREDPEVVEILRHRFERDGIDLYEGTKVSSVNYDKKRISVKVDVQGQEKTLQGSHLLLATGRRPTVEGLGLEKAGIKYTQHGIQVDDRLRTSQKNIFAIGDVIGSYQFTHVASYHAKIVLKNCLFRLPAKVTYASLPWVTYTDPEVAHVGMAHAEAQEKHPEGQTLTWPYKDCDRAQAERETEGMIKVSTTGRGQILGVSIIGVHAGELILPWGLAIENNLKIKAMADVIAAYPTFSEISKKVAGSYYTPLLFSPRTQKVVRFLMRYLP